MPGLTAVYKKGNTI